MQHKGTQVFKTERLILRKVELEDAENLTTLLNDKDVQEFLAGIPENYTVEMAVDYITNKLQKKYNEEDYYDWAVVEKESNKLIGRISIFKQDDYRMMVDLVWYIHKDYRGKGYITEAVKEIVKFLQRVGYKRIEAFADIKNTASKRVMEKCQMEFEGTLRGYIKLKDGYHDMYMFSIIKK